MKKLSFLLLAIFCLQSLHAQDAVHQTFKDRWVINSQSVETLPARKLDVRIAHRFGDFAGEAGGWSTFYGLENAADVSTGVEYGATDRLTVGLARSKGAGSLRQLLTASAKYRVLHQRMEGMPLSLTILGMTSVSTMDKSKNPSDINFFEVFPHRMVHHLSLLGAKKFSDRLSLQLSAGLTHRNVVPLGGENNIVHVGMATRVQLTHTLGLIADMSLPFTDDVGPDRYVPFGLGFEFDTGGHVFQLNFTNARGIMPTDYLPYTFSNWADGQWRIGFTISRLFNL